MIRATTATSARPDDVASDAAPELPRGALPSWWAAYAHARHCVEQRETDLAERLLRTLCDALPQRAEPYALLAHVLRASGKMQQAADLAQHALTLPIPTDGTQLLEPDAWRIQPLEELAISSWHLKERAVGQLAAEHIVHSRAATKLQRTRAVRHSGWYLDRR